MTLRAAYEGMPGDEASSMPWYIRAAENPASPVALPGAVDLFGHDCIHILLGRGMHAQDEAFVVGVTMGASARLTPWLQKIYMLWARCMYRQPYSFSRIDRVVFDVGVEFGRSQDVKPLHDVPWRDLLDSQLGELRKTLGIDRDRLTVIYETERVMWPDSPASQRLPRHRSMTVET
jgi:hypothetical protein